MTIHSKKRRLYKTSDELKEENMMLVINQNRSRSRRVELLKANYHALLVKAEALGKRLQISNQFNIELID